MNGNGSYTQVMPLSAALGAHPDRVHDAGESVLQVPREDNHILYNPASELDMPRVEKRLPRHILNVKEVEKVLAVPDLATPIGIRDRAILETFYSTGIRRLELIHLKLYDVDTDRGTIMIRQGKGKKDRMLPIGERALAWTVKYRDDVRPELACGADDATLFLTTLGEAFAPNRMTQMVREYIDAADTGKRGSCHLFRHTMETPMLENGADIHYIQARLGHAELSTTQIYTQVSVRKLKAIHTATHPAKPIGRVDNWQPSVDADLLLQTLAAEAIEDDE